LELTLNQFLITKEEFSIILVKIEVLTTSFHVLDGELKMENLIGLLETHGENTGENSDISELPWEIIN